MKRSIFFVLLVALVLPYITTGQTYHEVYPMGEQPSIRLASSYSTRETTLFEAYPFVRFSIKNDFVERLYNPEKKHMSGYYIYAKPQLRMYTSNSLPVKMPTYRVLLGTQHLFKIPQNKENQEQYYGFGFESGHYSNGQSGCAFSTEFEDGSDECLAVYNTITPDSDLSLLLNRNNGNFSTNLTKLTGYFQHNRLRPDGNTNHMHVFEFLYTIYHNRFLWLGDFGGYSAEDLEIYGRHRFQFYYAFTFFRDNETTQRIRLSQRISLIQGAHEHVNPWRSESQFTVFPFRKSPALGFTAMLIMGHDNYNFRFVDSGTILSGGVTWDLFPPIPRGH